MHKPILFALALVIGLSGCATKYGAKSIKRLDYYEDSLTYEAYGRLDPWEEAEQNERYAASLSRRRPVVSQ